MQVPGDSKMLLRRASLPPVHHGAVTPPATGVSGLSLPSAASAEDGTADVLAGVQLRNVRRAQATAYR